MNEALLAARIAGLKEQLLVLYEPDEVSRWFESPQSLLDGRRPIDLIADDCGYLLVSELVDTLLGGAYT